MPMGDMAWVSSPGTFALAAAVIAVSAVFYAILRGRLVTARQQDQREQDWKERLTEHQKSAAERLAESREREDLWRVAHGKSEENVRALSAQVDRLTVLGETTVAILQALPRKDRT